MSFNLISAQDFNEVPFGSNKISDVTVSSCRFCWVSALKDHNVTRPRIRSLGPKRPKTAGTCVLGCYAFACLLEAPIDESGAPCSNVSFWLGVCRLKKSNYYRI